MNKASYTDNVTKLGTVEQCKERYKLSRGLLLKVAEEGNAIRRFGRSIRIDIEAMDKAVEKH